MMLSACRSLASFNLTHISEYFCTSRKSRHPRRCVPVRRIARPELPVAVCAPAVDAAVAQHGACVVDCRGEGHDSWAWQ